MTTSPGFFQMIPDKIHGITIAHQLLCERRLRVEDRGEGIKTMKEAEARGLELARNWVDKKCLEVWKYSCRLLVLSSILLVRTLISPRLPGWPFEGQPGQ